MNDVHMNEPEFYASATLGFRQWHFSLSPESHKPTSLQSVTRHGSPSLQSMVRYGFDRPRYHWDLQGPNHASCSRLWYLKYQPGSLYELHGEVPAPGCSCGFYAYGRRHDSYGDAGLYVVGGVVAGWGELELHELGFKCGVAKILALFEPDPRKNYADYDGVASIQLAALKELCAENDIPLLEPDALRNEEEVRRYASERDLLLLEKQLSFEYTPWPSTEAIGGEEGLAS